MVNPLFFAFDNLDNYPYVSPNITPSNIGARKICEQEEDSFDRTIDRPPLAKLDSKTTHYPFGYHISHCALVVSHKREWIPNSFPRELGA